MTDTTEYNEISHPSHYNCHPSGVECRHLRAYLMSVPADVTKYIWRAGLKGEGTQALLRDLKKAAQYLEWMNQDQLPEPCIRASSNEALAKYVLKVHDAEEPGSLLRLWMDVLLYGMDEVAVFSMRLGFTIATLEATLAQGEPVNSVDPSPAKDFRNAQGKLTLAGLKNEPGRVAEDLDGDCWVYDSSRNEYLFRYRAGCTWEKASESLLNNADTYRIEWKVAQGEGVRGDAVYRGPAE